MVITEGVDYDYHAELFKIHNRDDLKSEYYRPVRVFTYQLGTDPNDGRQMEWIACANMGKIIINNFKILIFFFIGYYVNISTVKEVHEQVLKYLPVMSRPLNMNGKKPEPLWSALYVDLADRKLSNWLWNKYEGNRQRDRFLEFANRESIRLQMIFHDNSHFLKQTTHVN